MLVTRRVGFELALSSAPIGAAQGNALGSETTVMVALKGRHTESAISDVSPSQGLQFAINRIPRAMPWAGMLRPLRGEELQKSATSKRVSEVGGKFSLADASGYE